MKSNWFIYVFAVSLIACSYLPEPAAEMTGVRLETFRNYLKLEPENTQGISETGLILYPGGLVDPHAYLALASAFARSGRGHRVYIAKMPSNLAVLDISAARDIIREEDLEHWVIAGHSLGGAMACSMVEKDKGGFKGLILMAAYPAESVDLSSWDRPVLSISASEDLVVDAERYKKARSRLPPASWYELIEGGNHAGFGQYGEQEGDGKASISQPEQRTRVVELMQIFFLDFGLE